jgi:hypothetical protein
MSQMNGDQLTLALLVAIIGACVVIFGHWVRLHDNKARDAARVQEHSRLTLEWATGLATDPDPLKAGAGVAALGAIARAREPSVSPQDVAAVVGDAIVGLRQTRSSRSAA